MAILSEQDRSKHFSLVTLTGDALVGAIEHAQTVAEREAMRPLELTQFTETIDVPRSRKIPLKYQPIDSQQPVVVETQGHVNNQFMPLGGEHYVIDHQGVLEILSPTIQRIRVQYWSGLQDNPAVKSAVAAILYFHVLNP
jgi:hypothetical protein